MLARRRSSACPSHVLDEELLALSYFAEAQSCWADVGLSLPDDLADAQSVAGSEIPALGCVGLSAADVWQDSLEDARAVLAHVCAPQFCEPYPCPRREDA